jgi:hypothetical protein
MRPRKKGMLTRRFLIVAALFGVVAYGEDITLPLDDGSLVIRAQFIRHDRDGPYVPELTLKLMNQTSSPWRTLKLRFEIGGLCKGEPRQWTLPVVTSLGWSEDHPLVKEYSDTVLSLIGNVDGCKTEIINASLILAENSKTRIDGVSGERIDLEKQLSELKAKREFEAGAEAEEERKAAEVQAKRDADAALRRKRLAVEQKRKQAEADALYVKSKAEEDVKAAEKQRKVRAACMDIYKNTIDKKVKDLTVREEQQVRGCQLLGLYPPQ